jgi:hypothetical protein
MKIKDLKTIIYSNTGDIQFVIIYDLATNTDIINGCSIEYAVCHYGDKEVKRVSSDENMIVITI